MRLSKLPVRLRGIACALTATGLLIGCGANDNPPLGPTSVSSGGGSTSTGAPAIQGVTTPSAVSVVTAN